MRPIATFAFAAMLPVLLLTSGASAAHFGVVDRARFFSPDAVDQANSNCQQIRDRFHKDVLIETFPTIPQDMQAAYQQQGKDRFYQTWAAQRARAQAVDGILILITKDPPRLQIWDGNNTAQRLFSNADRDQLKQEMTGAFLQQQYDQGLLQAIKFIERQMSANASASARGGGAPAAGTPAPYSRANNRRSTNWGIGSIACVIIAVILVVVLIRGVFGRSGGGYYGGGGYGPGFPLQGGYPPSAYPPGAYPPGGGYAGGGGGFGRGFLGGLLGGALGGYAAQRWTEQNQGGNYAPPASGGLDQGTGVDTSGTSTGADFGPSDQGGGADFGSGGGADFGGGGADVGGGGSDFGGGDAGSSSGSDF